MLNKEVKKIEEKTEEKKVFFQIRMDGNLVKDFRSICKEQCLNGSEVTRQLIQNWVDEKKK